MFLIFYRQQRIVCKKVVIFRATAREYNFHQLFELLEIYPRIFVDFSQEMENVLRLH